MNTDVQMQIEMANARFATAFKAGDATSIASLYTASAELYPANSDAIRGTAAIREFWQAVIDIGLKGARLETTELETHADTAIEVGRYQLFAADDVVADHGKYVVIWKLDDRGWKLHRDIWTTSQSAPAPAG